AQKEPSEEGVLPTSLLQQPRKNPSAASLAHKKRREREKQEKIHRQSMETQQQLQIQHQLQKRKGEPIKLQVRNT
ncbi:hypothetical protein MKW98_024327, partial [Papaver atlanticum]